MEIALKDMDKLSSNKKSSETDSTAKKVIRDTIAIS